MPFQITGYLENSAISWNLYFFNTAPFWSPPRFLYMQQIWLLFVVWLPSAVRLLRSHGKVTSPRDLMSKYSLGKVYPSRLGILHNNKIINFNFERLGTDLSTCSRSGGRSYRQRLPTTFWKSIQQYIPPYSTIRMSNDCGIIPSKIKPS